jgi:transcriptional regulator with XRE-family HTH domain
VSSETSKSSPPVSPLKAARLSLGLRLRDVAEQASCAVSLVSMAENGYRPGINSRERIAQAVGASSGSFWPGN